MTKTAKKPIAPYMAVGLSTVVYGVAERKHIKRNLETIEDNIHAAVSMVNINMPVKLIALAEGAMTGFTDEAFDLQHTLRTLAGSFNEGLLPSQLIPFPALISNRAPLRLRKNNGIISKPFGMVGETGYNSLICRTN